MGKRPCAREILESDWGVQRMKDEEGSGKFIRVPCYSAFFGRGGGEGSQEAC